MRTPSESHFRRMRLRRLGCGCLVLILVLGGLIAYFLPLRMVHVEVPLASSTEAAREASENFWDIYHASDIDALVERGGVMDQMLAAWPGSDGDTTLAALIGAASLWDFQVRRDESALGRAIEFGRIAVADEEQTFAPAIVATASWQQAMLDGEDGLLPDLHIDLLANTQSFPEFEGFNQGWLLSAMLDHTDPHFGNAQLGYNAVLSSCAGFSVPPDQAFNRFTMIYFSLKSYFTTRLCYNNNVAPHNLEGFALAQGDLLVKAGELDAAVTAYNNAKASPMYPSWDPQLKAILEERLSSDLGALRNRFRAQSGRVNVEQPSMSFQAPWACMSCHAKK